MLRSGYPTCRWRLAPFACGVVLGVLLLMPAVVARAQEPVVSDAVLEQLNSEDFAQRQEAMTQLLQDNTLTPQKLLPAIERATTSEQRHRLLGIARHHMIRLMRQEMESLDTSGAIGVYPVGVVVQMEEAQPPVAAVRVIQTFPGFPGHAYLRIGDLILNVDGQPIRLPDTPRRVQTTRHFVQIIKTKLAGQPLRMTVLRDGQTMEVTMVLGRKDALGRIYGQNAAPEGRLLEPYMKEWTQYYNRAMGSTEAIQPVEADNNEPHAAG